LAIIAEKGGAGARRKPARRQATGPAKGAVPAYFVSRIESISFLSNFL